MVQTVTSFQRFSNHFCPQCTASCNALYIVHATHSSSHSVGISSLSTTTWNNAALFPIEQSFRAKVPFFWVNIRYKTRESFLLLLPLCFLCSKALGSKSCTSKFRLKVYCRSKGNCRIQFCTGLPKLMVKPAQILFNNSLLI